MINLIAPLVQAGLLANPKVYKTAVRQERYSQYLSAPALPLVLEAVLLLCAAGCERDPATSSVQPPPPPENSPADQIMPAQPSPQVPEPPATHPPANRAATSTDTTTDEPPPSSPETADVPAWLPLADATSGEWVEYQTLDGRTLRYEVLKVSPLAVITRVTVRETGRTWGEPATRDDDPAVDLLAREAQRRKAARHVEVATIQAAGRSWEATLYEDRWTDEEIRYVRRTWVSSQVPYLGTLRMELHGDDQLEARLVLHDYGPR